MSNRTAITIHVAPDVLAFLAAEAQGATEHLQGDGNAPHGDTVPIESIASVLFERAARQLMQGDVTSRLSPAVAVDTEQEDIDQGTAARVQELLREGHADQAHELTKTIETPEIRANVDPNN